MGWAGVSFFVPYLPRETDEEARRPGLPFREKQARRAAFFTCASAVRPGSGNQPFFSILAQVSRRVAVRLKTSDPGLQSLASAVK